MLKRDAKCQRCPLHKTAEHVCLLGQGPRPNEVMIIGEAPGAEEDEEGLPFVGRAGQLLNELLENAGFERSDLYVTNAVHCRPPDNRAPKRAEIKACRYWLNTEQGAVRPKFVLLLGNTAIQAVLDLKGIRALRGKPIQRDGITYFPVYHPSFALRDPRFEPVLRQDIRTFFSIVNHGGIPQEKGVSYTIVNDEATLDKMIEDLENTTRHSCDLETNGLNPWAKGAKIVSFGAGTRNHQWIVPLNHPQSKWRKSPVKRIVKAMAHAEKVFHNGKFDSLWLRVHEEVDLLADFDTMLAHFLIDENALHGLKVLAQHYYGAPDYDIEKDEKKGDAPIEKIAHYHAHDLYYTLALRSTLHRELSKDKPTLRIFEKIMMPCARLFVDIEENGVYLDPTKIKEVQKHLEKQRDEAQAILDKTAKINWGSPDQVAKVFFEQLRLKPLDKTKGGKNSTSESVLKRLDHPVARALIKYREAMKNLSTYIMAWQNEWLDENGRMHPSFKLHGTVTGRLSCEDPNLQQVPRDPIIRSLITAPPGWTLIEADLSQIEMRIAAEMSGDRELMHSFMTGVDVHWKTALREIFRGGAYPELVMETAKKITGKRLNFGQSCDALLTAGPKVAEGIDSRWKEIRKKAKAINFGYLFGMWWKKFITYARDNYDVIVSEREAQDSRVSYFELYKELNEWHKRQKRFAKRNGYVRSISGRKRRLPDAMRDDDAYEVAEAQRQGINAPVQSFANELNLMSLIELCAELDWSYHRPIGTIHDAILSEVRNDKVDFVCEKYLQVMRKPKLLDQFGIELRVPIEAEVKRGAWGVGK